MGFEASFDMRDDEIYDGAKPKDLTVFEFDMLTGAWRHYEHGATITSSSFPGDVVCHYWHGNYTDRSRRQIASQFLLEHSRLGEDSWDSSDPMDATPWLKFHGFCKGIMGGFAMVTAKRDGLKATGLAFRIRAHVSYDEKKQERWYFMSDYVKSPYVTREIHPAEIISIKDFGCFVPESPGRNRESTQE